MFLLTDITAYQQLDYKYAIAGFTQKCKKDTKDIKPTFGLVNTTQHKSGSQFICKNV